MSFHPDSPGLSAERLPSQAPPADRGPEMYRLDPRYEIADQPGCEIGDLPAAIGGERTAPTAGGADAASSRYCAR